MKTTLLRTNRIIILFSSTAVLLFPLISDAQVKVLSGGDVGFGTTSPHSTIQAVPIRVLDLNGTGRTSYVLHGGTTGQETCFATSGIGTYFDIAGHSTASNNFFAFRTSNTAGSFIVGEKMRITSEGNVGVGTTAPGKRLDVNGDALVGASSRAAGHAFLFLDAGTAITNEPHFRFCQSTVLKAQIKWSSDFNGGIDFYTVGMGTSFVRFTNFGKVGIGLTNPAFKLDVTGTTGSIAHKSDNTTTWDQTSDVRLKTNITPFTDGLNIVKEINPVNYKYNGKAGTEMILQHIGVLAQDIQQVAPYTVGTYMAKLDSTDTLETQLLTFNPHGLFFVLINAVKQLDSTNTALAINDSTKGAEIQAMQTTDSTLKIKLLAQDSMITSLQNQLNQLASAITDCCNNNGNNGHGNNLNQSGTNNSEQNNRSMFANDGISQRGTTLTDVELSNKNIVVLNQNVPNPFAEQTAINYSLPDNTVKGQMLFYNAQGKLIQSTELTQKGRGTLNVFASDLSSGIYTYTLVVDGKIIETKKMVKQ
jgi:hypothetical protein